MEVGGPEVQDQPWLYSEFEASLGYIRPCLQKLGGGQNRIIVLDTGALGTLFLPFSDYWKLMQKDGGLFADYSPAAA